MHLNPHSCMNLCLWMLITACTGCLTTDIEEAMDLLVLDEISVLSLAKGVGTRGNVRAMYI